MLSLSKYEDVALALLPARSRSGFASAKAGRQAQVEGSFRQTLSNRFSAFAKAALAL
jgi:hypothetical protein